MLSHPLAWPPKPAPVPLAEQPFDREAIRAEVRDAEAAADRRRPKLGKALAEYKTTHAMAAAVLHDATQDHDRAVLAYKQAEQALANSEATAAAVRQRAEREFLNHPPAALTEAVRVLRDHHRELLSAPLKADPAGRAGIHRRSAACVEAAQDLDALLRSGIDGDLLDKAIVGVFRQVDRAEAAEPDGGDDRRPAQCVQAGWDHLGHVAFDLQTKANQTAGDRLKLGRIAAARVRLAAVRWWDDSPDLAGRVREIMADAKL